MRGSVQRKPQKSDAAPGWPGAPRPAIPTRPRSLSCRHRRLCSAWALVGGRPVGRRRTGRLQVLALRSGEPAADCSLRRQTPACCAPTGVPEVRRRGVGTPRSGGARCRRPVEMFESHSAQPSASGAFPLRIVGARMPAKMEVVLRDVPAAARLSRGERRTSRRGRCAVDLEDLHLTLNEGTPDAFDIVSTCWRRRCHGTRAVSRACASSFACRATSAVTRVEVAGRGASPAREATPLHLSQPNSPTLSDAPA